MYPTDPTLYGATLPQRELPITTPYVTPFYGQNLPIQTLPMQALPWQAIPWQNVQRFVPPYQGYQASQQPTYSQFLGTMPFMVNPYMSAFSQPFGYGFQRPFHF